MGNRPIGRFTGFERNNGRIRGYVFGVPLVLGLQASPLLATETEAKHDRWYRDEQVDQGRILFQKHCAQCHGARGESMENWHRLGADGFLPPPPLNGQGHSWHHKLPLLRRIIRRGGDYGGRMPAFGHKLSSQEIDAVIAGFQSLWPDPVYQRWERTGQGPLVPPDTRVSLQPLY